METRQDPRRLAISKRACFSGPVAGRDRPTQTACVSMPPSEIPVGPDVGDEQGSSCGMPPLRLSGSPGQELCTLFRPGEVFTSPQSAQIRRIEEAMIHLQLDDVYEALVAPWQISRTDIHEPHGIQWSAEVQPQYWVSTDVGKICFAAVQKECGLFLPGQYYKPVDGEWEHFAGAKAAPRNVGGSHACCIDLGAQTNSTWTLAAKLSDYGLVLGREGGLRVEFAALVRNDCEAIVASVGSHDECRSLFPVDWITLHGGHLALVDPTELEGIGGDADGPVAPAGMGSGYYPVFVSRDKAEQVCRVTVVFHESRVSKLYSRFPPKQE